MFTRQIGKLLRGRSTPVQIMMAAILGSMIGFVPGFREGPGLLIALTLLLIVLNANLALAALVAAAAKLLSLLLLPVSFAIGRALLDGPAQGVFKWMINAPVLALFGLEHYVTTGGLVPGMLFGIASGVLAVKLLTRFRLKMATLEEGSDRYKNFTSKRWVKVVTFIFIGGNKGKRTYAELASKKVGNPIRILGVVFAGLVISLLFILQSFFSGPILTAYLRSGLERANGATVDIDNAEVDLKAGRMVVTNLAMADPNALETDLFRAALIEADISAADLLRKRVRFDRIVITDAVSGERRVVRGRLVSRTPEPLPPPPADPTLNDKTIEEYIAEAKLWKQRLAQVRSWLEKLGGSEQSTQPQHKRETLDQRIRRQIRESGYASVKASHLIDGAPSLAVTQLIAEGVRTTQLSGEVLDITGEHLSTHPHLLSEAPEITVKSRSGNITAVMRLNGASMNESDNYVQLTYLNLPVEAISKSLTVGGNTPITGGTMDIDLRGQWSSAGTNAQEGSGGVGYLDLPMNVTLRNTTLSLPKLGSSPIDAMTLPLGLRGPIDNPRIAIDSKALADALAKAGADAMANKLRAEAEGKLDEATSKLKGKLDEKLGEKLGESINDALGEKASDVLGNLLPGGNRKKD